MNFYESLYQQLEEIGLHLWTQQLRATLSQRLLLDSHGRMEGWLHALQSLPCIRPSFIDLKDEVAIGSAEELDEFRRAELISCLQSFHPWRKGPYTLFGIKIDTEWRSDWKWDRVLPHIQPLIGRRVLDVGCGNGYHGWRMRGAGADFVLGIDPFPLSVMQFQVMQHFLDDPQHHVIPIGIEDVPPHLACFDTVFSMGVLYHRRSPLDHLLELKGCLRPGGELILETLIIEGDEHNIFMPPARYAKMRNVWFIPSIAAVILWLQRCGFGEISCVDINRTTLMEQRSTEWMRFESLADFLDPLDHEKTIEGHPAPLRGIFRAVRM